MDDFFHNISQMLDIPTDGLIGVVLFLAFVIWYIGGLLDEMGPKAIRRIFAVMLALLVATFGCAYNQFIMRKDAEHTADVLKAKLTQKDMPIVVPTPSKDSQALLNEYLSAPDDDANTGYIDNDVTVPNVSVPDVSIPDIDVPDVEMPNIVTPSLDVVSLLPTKFSCVASCSRLWASIGIRFTCTARCAAVMAVFLPPSVI